MQALPAPSREDIAVAVDARAGGLSDLFANKHLPPDLVLGRRAIIMDAADRNLLQIYQQERPNLNAVRLIIQQVCEAVSHLHDHDLMHGDLKMLNIVRFQLDGRYRLIDFDASAPISVESPRYAAAKFSSAVLPPELFHVLVEGDAPMLFEYWAGCNAELREKVVPLTSGAGRQLVVKSFRTDECSIPITQGLPYSLVEASSKIDCWAVGAIMYTLCAGQPLVTSTRDEDCASGDAMSLLHDWGMNQQVVSAKLEKVKNPLARDLIGKLLQRDASIRQTAGEVLRHGLFDTMVRDVTSNEDQLKLEQMKRDRLHLLKTTTECVHIISTPYLSGQSLAKSVANENESSEAGGVKAFCYNPNEDCPQSLDVSWLDTWMAICDNTVRTGGKVFIIFRSDGEGKFGCDQKGSRSLDGQAQPGEIKYATEKGCELIWVDSVRSRTSTTERRKARRSLRKVPTEAQLNTAVIPAQRQHVSMSI